MANIGYIRVSTQHQNTGRQHEDFSAKGITIDKLYEEKISGKNTDRPQLKAMLQYVREGDTVYAESFSRLARSTRDLLEIVEDLTSKGVQFVSLKENVDTSTPQGKFMLTVFAGLAQLERDTILQRQREGIDLCLSEGRAYGRPTAKISDTFATHYQQWKAGKIKAIDFMKAENLPKSTFYKLVKRFEEDTNK
ncbi:recombinase family protein [uncultured Phascolarctobacterium sp.]|uniref:recombinase family protein n=1 Tax=uncultured Phascolarctobacterium sp. TaxID=512296 RepID=UPI0025F39595|nr:recombinase family protein [uncultured Phascolarctobacterium sp.]